MPIVVGPWRSLFKLHIQTSSEKVERPHSRKQPAWCRHIEFQGHDIESLPGLSKAKILGLINIP
jgi:hypothetical protein